MADPSSGRAWSDEQILEVFGGADVVVARDGVAAEIALPPPFAHRAGGPLAPWSDQVSRLYPSDRLAMVRAWWDALQHPGELQDVTVRSQERRGWRLLELRFLNLLDQPGIQSVLVGTVDRGATEVDEVPAVVVRHDRPAWVLQELDPMGTILRTEGDAAAVFNQPAEALAGSNVLEVLHPGDHDAALTMWVELMADPGATRVIRHRVLRPGASPLWIESTVTNRLDDEIGAMVALSIDVSDRLAQERAIRASEEEFRTLAEEAPVAVFRASADGRITFGNGRWFQLTAGVGVVEFLVDLVAPEWRVDWRDRWACFVDDPTADTLTLEYPTPDERAVLSVHCRHVGQGVERRIVGVATDVTDTAALRHRADHDSLTGVLNREAFDRSVEAAIRSGASSVVAFIDLDNFKDVNDELGHEAGDHLLVEVAHRLAGSVRPGDDVGRYGGDEFVVLCTGVPDGGETSLRNRIRDALSEPISWEGHERSLQASIGIARAKPGDALTDVVRRADHAMYDEKRTRRRQLRNRQGWWVSA